MASAVPKKVAIIGAGLAGLTVAFRLHELQSSSGIPLEIKIFESADRPGGVIRTLSRDGFLMEQGPDSFLTEKPAALALCSRLKLQDQIIATQPTYRKSFIYRQGQLIPIPSGFYLMAPASARVLLGLKGMSLVGKVRMLAERWVPPSTHKKDESVSQFVLRRFGRETLEQWARPMIGGIYAADTDVLSAQSSIPQFYAMEKEQGSITAGLKARKQKADQDASGPRYGLFASLRLGMQQLVDSLYRAVPNHQFSFSVSIKQLSFENKRWILNDGMGKKTYDADAVCLALPAYRSAGLFSRFDERLSDVLNAIPYGDAATIHLAFHRKDIGHALDGFGFVVPPAEGLCMIGCSFPHRKFDGRVPSADYALLRVFLGGKSFEKVKDCDDRQIEGLVLSELRECLTLRGKPIFTSLHRYALAMPHYTVGHQTRLQQIKEKLNQHPGCFLAGNAYDGIGIPDTIQRSELCAAQMMEYFDGAYD